MDFGREPDAADRVALTDPPEVQAATGSAAGDEVTACLAFLARRHERPASPVIIRAGLALDESGALPFHQIESALDQIGLRGEPYEGRFAGLRSRHLPAILKLVDGAAVLLELKGGEALLFRPRDGAPVWVDTAAFAPSFAGSAVIVEPDPTQEREGERPWQRSARAHWFWSEVWKVRGSFTYLALAAAIINLLALSLPLFTMNVYDRIIPNKSAVSLWVLAIGVMLALSLEFSLRIARARLVDDVGRTVDARLSQRLFEKVMNVPLAAREGSTGALARRVSDYETVREFFASTTVVLVVDMMFLVVFLAIITLLAGWLVLVPVTGIALMAGAGFVLQKSMARASIDAQADASLQHSILVESIAGQETLKATGAEGRMLGRWRRYADMNAATQERLRGLTAISINLATLCQQLMSVGLVIGGFYLFNAGTISMGAIIAIVMLSGRAMAPVGQFAFLMTRARHAFTVMDSLQSLSDLPDERFTGRSILPTIARGAIRFDAMSFRYPNAGRDSLSGVSLTIAPGERIAIIGRVASGKSTFGRVLCGLYAPTEGAYLIDDLDSRQHHPHQLREAFRYVGQDAELFRGTIRDNLALATADASDERLLDAMRKSGADLYLSRDSAGFDLFVGERGASLSGGQRSFLVLARALVAPGKLLYLDEPTGAMDTQTELLFIDKLSRAIPADQTLIVSTHRNAMLSIVDRLIVLDQGRIIADGPKEQVLGALAANAGAQA